MKYSYNWLKELSGSKKSVQEIASLLTMRAFEIEEIEEIGNDLENVIVGEIVEIEKHPNADRLQITKVNVGKEILQIVCGAHNISVGDKVPVAMIGAVLPGNFSAKGGPASGWEIKESEIREVKSFGMLCAEDELGLGSDHNGILLLDKNAKVGSKVADILGNQDTAIDIKVLPDRGHDAISHVGMAREITALEGAEIDYAYDDLILSDKKAKDLKISIDEKLCRRYIGAILENVSVKESPRWMKNRLLTSGIRPINNVVDVTNYVMLELGQPMHAFDFEIIGKEINVRSAKKGEKIKLLDETQLQLNESDVIIADSKNPIALAGVMGGINSGITNSTTSIILECANFDPVSIRKTRVKYCLPTDAAVRFEKELDPNLAEKAMVRAIELLEHIAGAKFGGIVDAYPKKIKSWKVELDLAYLDNLLGISIKPADCKKILTGLGLKVEIKKEKIIAQIPTFRIDLTTSENLIEEIGRIYGYEKIKSSAPLVQLSGEKKNEKRAFNRLMKNILVKEEFSEVYNYSFYSLRDANLAQLGSMQHLELDNPQNPFQQLMRISLLPGMLKSTSTNLKNFRDFRIFELGRVYWKGEDVLPEERTMLMGMLVSDKKPSKDDKYDKRNAIFYDIKGAVDSIFEDIGISNYYYNTMNGVPTDLPKSVWHQSRSAEIKIEGHEKAVGFIGEINPFILAQFDIHTRVAAFEFDLEKLRMISQSEKVFVPIRKYPAVLRDISLLANKDVAVSDIISSIKKSASGLIMDVDLFDIFDFSNDKISYAFHISFGLEDRTLTGEKVEESMKMIEDNLEKELKIELRR